jgi:hypothetical protein
VIYGNKTVNASSLGTDPLRCDCFSRQCKLAGCLWATHLAGATWVMATRNTPGSRDVVVLHHRDPAAHPRILSPAVGTIRGRRLTGEVRDAGPGSHIGKALCGMGLSADELWARADHLIRGVVGSGAPAGRVALCERCAGLAGQSTLEAVLASLAAPGDTG